MNISLLSEPELRQEAPNHLTVLYLLEKNLASAVGCLTTTKLFYYRYLTFKHTARAVASCYVSAVYVNISAVGSSRSCQKVKFDELYDLEVR